MTDIIIDAKNQKLGRLASKIATILQNKTSAAFNPRLKGENKVIVKNIESLEITGKKADQKVYYRHTGYMGHLREKTYAEAFASDPSWVLKHAVRGMLPKNRLQDKRMKQLIIEKKS
ncbi:MAG: 50S ribosomal protein L13 [Candidatus Colwellbacteria bacterium]|nr:50S ribosomal protein L13 [Candidatus Colwellbacteria bacterium]